MVNEVWFVISEEDLASGPETKLDHSEVLCGRSFITVKGTEKDSDIDIRSAPLLVLARELYIFLISYYNKSKESLEVVKIIPDPFPQFTF